MNKTKIPWCDRFWAKVESTNNCWLWKAGCFTNGYGQFRIGNKKLKAHRVMFLLLKGNIPHGMIVRHTCDNPKCVNPNHLLLGTYKDNAYDRDSKNRGIKGRKIHKDQAGEKNPAAKLNVEKVSKIRFMWPDHSYRKLSKLFKISASQVANIVKGRSWQYE